MRFRRCGTIFSMDSPYRSAPGAQQAQRPRDAGIVGDIVSQFADRFAFFRELIQNSIDANTENIEVSLRYDDALKVLTVAVEDRGEGMPRDIIENGLLVLFRSTKEKDESKIGKFGIGFVSVLAVEPSIVRVISTHGGTRHTLHLYPDFSYELFDSGRSSNTGTTVELEVPMNADEVGQFATDSRDALHRWCRHATVMITITAQGAQGSHILSERIDGPLALDGALASVERSTSDGSIRAVVGLSVRPTSAFFNHGLLLYETQESLVGGLSFVIQDARLGHTLSRDNVRRDRNFDRALDFVRELGESLPAELIHQMNVSLEIPDPKHYRLLARAIMHSGISIENEEWPLPLIEPVHAIKTTSVQAFRSAGNWTASRRSPLTKTLAAAKIPVVDREYTKSSQATKFEEAVQIESVLAPSWPSMTDDYWFGVQCPDEKEVHGHLTLVSPATLSNSDLVLLEHLHEVLRGAFRAPSKIILAQVIGAYSGELALAGDHDDAFVGAGAQQPWILDNTRAVRNPFRVLRRPALILNTTLASVGVARTKAETEPYVAAQGLARLILLDLEKLDSKRSEKLLDSGLEQLLRASP